MAVLSAAAAAFREKLQHQLARLVVPAVCSPMFLVSTPQLVLASCRAGVVGSFPALNQRTTEGYEAWLNEIESATDLAAPFGVNLIVHKSNPRLAADLEVTVRHRVPIVITSLGAVRDVVDAVHSYGGLVWHDVISLRHAKKAAGAGVDGIIAVCAGAGGHAGTRSPFALIHEIRQFYQGTIIAAGAIATGSHVAAARLLGADYAYLGTRLITTHEASAPLEYKTMIGRTTSDDILYTDKVSGVNANFLEPSLKNAGIDVATMKRHEGTPDFGAEMDPTKKAWKDIWSAGHGVMASGPIISVAELVAQLRRQYEDARAGLPKLPPMPSRL